MTIWDEFRGGSDDRWKPENVGDAIAGEIVRIRVVSFDDGSRVPALTVRKDDGTEADVLAGQAQLRIKLADLGPEAGDRIAIKFTGVENRGGGKTLKLFDVAVKKTETTATAMSVDDLL